jgi:hypothetical protein
MMHQQQGIRRLCCALLVMVVAFAQLGPEPVSATAHKRPDFGSAEGFKLECELLGGTYSEDGIGNTNCHYPDGTWTQCDANGNDCWITPPRTRPAAEPLDLDDVAIGEATTDHGKTSATAPETVGPTVAAVDDEKRAKAKNKRSKGKKRKK